MSLHLAYPVHFFHLFAQTGNLRRWPDRRAGSPGVITSFVFVYPRRSSGAALGYMPVGVRYNRNCLHGGPPVSVIRHLHPTLRLFLDTVFQNQNEYCDVLSLAQLLASPQFAGLMSHHIARVLLSWIFCFVKLNGISILFNFLAMM